MQRSRQGGGGNIGCPRASKALVAAGQRPAGLPAYPPHEAISHTGEIFLKHSRSKLIASATEMPMLVLMNLIWRRLAYTMLIGMRSKLIRQ